MTSKDREIRRLALLKTSTASFSALSLLNFSLEVLKNDAEPLTVDRLFETAEEILKKLPALKDKIDKVIICSATKAENWVTNEVEQTEEKAENQTPPPEPKPVEKEDKPKDNNGNTGKLVGKVEAVSKTGTGIKVNGEWYNLFKNTEKKIDKIEKDMQVEIYFIKTEKGNLIKTIK